MPKESQRLSSIKERLNKPGIPVIDRAQREIFRNILLNINLPESTKALSVSTGDGFWDYYAFKSNSKIKYITATDIVDNPVNIKDINLLNKLGKWNFCKVKPESNLSFANNSFDLIFHQDVVEHVEKPYLFLKEQYRVLKKGGFLVVGTPNLFRPVNLIKLIAGLLSFPVKIGYYEKIGDYIHQQEFCEYGLKMILKEVGFSKISTFYSFFGLHFLNLTFSSIPKNKIGRSLSHYLNFVAEK